jgi:WD40 repeat protein
VAFSASGQALASVDTSASLGIWGITTPPQPGSKPIAVITSTSRPRGTIATVSDGGEIALWKPGGEASYAALPMPPSQAVSAGASSNATTDIALSPDGSTLAVARPGNQITLWNTRTGHMLGTLTAPGALTSIAYRPVTGPAVIAAGSPDGYIYIWGPNASQPIQLGYQQALVTSVAFSPDGTLLAAGSDDGTFLLARHRGSGDWIPFQPTGGPLNAVETVAFSPDGEILATGSSAGTVELWNIANPGDPVRLTTLTDSAQSVISVTFSHSGELAASYDDGTIRLWDIRNPPSAVPLATLSGLASPTSVTWQTDSRALSGATADGALLTWDTEPSDFADRICDSRLSGNADDLIPYLAGVSYHPICPGE